jgi:hypothetical protein
MALLRTRHIAFWMGFSCLALVAGTVVAVPASAVNPNAWTTRVNSFTRDSFGNPAQISFSISGPATTYAICLAITSAPSYNTKATSYDASTYGSYAPCRKFTLSSSTDTRRFGTYFTFGGPATYVVKWYVPDVPANGGNKVGSVGSFKWANSNGSLSPCPPDPQLMIGVWRPSRLRVLNRCKTTTGSNLSSSGIAVNSLDKDRGWRIKYGTSSRHVEYVLRDQRFLPSPAYGSTWTITGVYVCDTYHGWTEFHPVFKAINGPTYLSGPQYSTATPSVSGTWSTKSCP